jgi:hypothetical protein
MGELSRHVEIEVQRFPFPPTDWAPPCNEFSRGAFFVDALMAASEGPPMPPRRPSWPRRLWAWVRG